MAGSWGCDVTARSASPKEVDKLQAYLAECVSSVACSPCAEVRERLRLLGVKPETVPVEHRAKSSGRLGTPDRNHTCETCGGLGEVSIYPCRACLGTGELTASGVPAGGAS